MRTVHVMNASTSSLILTTAADVQLPDKVLFVAKNVVYARRLAMVGFAISVRRILSNAVSCPDLFPADSCRSGYRLDMHEQKCVVKH